MLLIKKQHRENEAANKETMEKNEVEKAHTTIAAVNKKPLLKPETIGVLNFSIASSRP